MADQITKGDLKGDLAQRLECATCTRKLNQVEDFEIVQLDKKESNDPKAKRAVTIMCAECIKLKQVPIRGYRYLAGPGGNVINEFRIEDLPDFADSNDVNAAEDEGEESGEETTTRRRRSR